MRPPHRSRPTPIGGILEEFVASLPQAADLRPSSDEAAIRAVLGKLATYCPGVRLREGHLLLTTSLPTVAHHLRAHAPALLAQMQSAGIAVQDIAAEIV
jgi:hypothetical protein